MGMIENLKEVANVLQKADNIELYKRLLEAMNVAYEMQSEIIELKEKVKSLESIINDSEELNYKENAYWKNDSGPFCSNCWDVNKILVRLHSENHVKGTCPNCKNDVIYNLDLNAKLKKEQLERINQMNQENQLVKW